MLNKTGFKLHWFLVYGLHSNYKITGHVENVFFATSSAFPCYVAVESVNGSQYNFYYHAANNIEMCKFAERCMDMNILVTMHAYIDNGANNGISGIEYAGRKSKFDYPGHVY